MLTENKMKESSSIYFGKNSFPIPPAIEIPNFLLGFSSISSVIGGDRRRIN
jgi:hypothetical protein